MDAVEVPRRGAVQGEESTAIKEAKQNQRRLQNRAPGSLQLVVDAKTPEDCFAPAAIPLLSPLVLSPTAAAPPVWDVVAEEEESKLGGEVVTSSPTFPAEGWRHPALPVPVMDPAALVPLFGSQCST